MLGGPTPHPRCEVCGFALNHEWIDPLFHLNSRQFDLSCTYDGYYIASQRFCDFVSGARFTTLRSEPGYFSLTSDEVVRFDAERRKTRFEDLCERCGCFRSVAGATPVFLLEDAGVPERLVRRGIEFGSGDELHPLLLVGPALGAELARVSMNGLHLEAISAP
jgi:hypothetical protein